MSNIPDEPKEENVICTICKTEVHESDVNEEGVCTTCSEAGLDIEDEDLDARDDHPEKDA